MHPAIAVWAAVSAGVVVVMVVVAVVAATAAMLVRSRACARPRACACECVLARARVCVCVLAGGCARGGGWLRHPCAFSKKERFKCWDDGDQRRCQHLCVLVQAL